MWGCPQIIGPSQEPPKYSYIITSVGHLPIQMGFLSYMGYLLELNVSEC